MSHDPQPWLALASLATLCACSLVPAGAVRTGASRSVDPTQLVVTSGAIDALGSMRFQTRSSTLRAQLRDGLLAALELEFRYLGPSASAAPLASGELRRQIGIKLRAKDSCNVVYVMWHIEPRTALEVSFKSNPGQSQHRECGDRGYTFLRPRWTAQPTPIEVGARHTLLAEIKDDELSVFADGALRWVGALPAAALALDGPAGLRADNGSFEIALRGAP